MSTVDPYVVGLPQIISNSDGSPSSEFLQWLIYDNRFKHDLWRNITGGTGDPLTNAQISNNVISHIYARLACIEESIEDNPFSIDSSGWTADIGEVTVDMSKA